jgi:hypothetical protein
VFLSHCGQNSFLEAIWSAVPILALPFMADQVRLLRAPMPCNAHATAHC